MVEGSYYLAVVRRESDNSQIGIPLGKTTLLVDNQNFLPIDTRLRTDRRNINRTNYTQIARVTVEEALFDSTSRIRVTDADIEDNPHSELATESSVAGRERRSNGTIFTGYVPWEDSHIQVDVMSALTCLQNNIPYITLGIPEIRYRDELGDRHTRRLPISIDGGSLAEWPLVYIVKYPPNGDSPSIFDGQWATFKGDIRNVSDKQARNSLRKSDNRSVGWDPELGMLFNDFKLADLALIPRPVIASLATELHILYPTGRVRKGKKSEDVTYAAVITTPFQTIE